MQAWRLPRNIKTHWNRISEATPGQALTFGPRGILRLPMRSDVFLHTRHALVDPAAAWRGCLFSNAISQ